MGITPDSLFQNISSEQMLKLQASQLSLGTRLIFMLPIIMTRRVRIIKRQLPGVLKISVDFGISLNQ